MRMNPRWLASALALSLAGFAQSASSGEPGISFTDGVLTVKTGRYEVTWREGCMVGLRTLLPRPAALTVQGAAMGVERLPNGLGSLYGHTAEARKQHHPWLIGPLGRAFPAQHMPCADTQVRFERIARGARLTYSGLKGEPKATLVQDLTVEAATGDLVVRQQGASPNPGVFGIGFSLLNLRPDIEYAVPYFTGQRWGAAFGKGRRITIGWPQFWNAGLVIGEVSGGGAFAVWADDPDMRPKYLHYLNPGDAVGLGFQANAEAPYGDKRQAEVFAWRFNTFGGSWMEPAQRYKEWMVRTHKLVPRKQRSPKWASEVAMVWPGTHSEADLKAMAKLIDPRKVIIQHWGWLRGFNRRIPEYIPKSPKFADIVAAARRLGYHNSAYTSLALVDRQTHPTMMRDYGLEAQYHAPWKPKAPAKSWLVYVHAGSAEWRAFYAAKMAEVNAKVGLDCFYQDVTGCGTGSSGVIEGRNFHQAVVAAEDAIKSRLPNVALTGEFWDEVNVCREDFGLQNALSWNPGAKWDGRTHRDMLALPGQPHPILSFLFSDFCVHWMHQVPIRNTRLFHQAHNMLEVVGGIPVWTTKVDDLTSEARVMLERARLWADGFRPWFPAKWEDGVVSYLRNDAGRVAKHVRRGNSTFCYESNKLRYGRVRGLASVKLGEPVSIDGWVGYGPAGPIGLDPDQWYCVFPGTPAGLPVTITRLPDGARIEGARLTDAYCLVALGGSGVGTVAWTAPKAFLSVSAGDQRLPATARQAEVTLPTTLLFARSEPTTLVAGEPLKLGEWQHHIVSQGSILKPGGLRREGDFPIAGVRRHGYMVMPPSGGIGSEASIDALVRLPADARLTLKAALGIVGQSGDGVHFVVRVNGREVWRRYRPTKREWDAVAVPLGKYAGRTVVLSLAVDCGKGGFNLSCDESVWGEPQFVIGDRKPERN